MSETDLQNPPFLGSEIDPPEPAAARFHVLPVPWERTVSYGEGTGAGPAAILRASWQLETWDGGHVPADAGIYTHAPVNVNGAPQAVLARISEAVSTIVEHGAAPVVLGGEHTVTVGVVQGLLDAHRGDVGVVQIDAHADLRASYLGDELSHACAMRRVIEKGVPLYQLGVRAMCAEEAHAREHYGVWFLDAQTLVPNAICAVDLPPDFPERVFVTVDVDGLDPSIFPSTGTPVPGGLGWYQTLALVASVARQRTLVGFDIMEFAPIAGFHCYEFAAAQLAYKIMGIELRMRR